MDFVLAQNLTIGFHPRGVAVAVMAGRGDYVISQKTGRSKSSLAITANCFIRRNQVKTFGVSSGRLSEWLYVARHQEVKRFDLYRHKSCRR